ncbi:hypothetical protein D3C81_2204430 [compost metagenome]
MERALVFMLTSSFGHMHRTVHVQVCQLITTFEILNVFFHPPTGIDRVVIADGLVNVFVSRQ